MERILRESRIFYGSEASCSKRNIVRPAPRSRAMAPKRGPKQRPVPHRMKRCRNVIKAEKRPARDEMPLIARKTRVNCSK